MSITSLVNRPCIIVHRGEDLDDFDPTGPDEDDVDTVCELQQQGRDEPEGQAETSVTTWLFIFPAGTEADSGDAVLVGSEEYELTGDPEHVRNPRTQVEHHVEATAVQTRGPGGS